jgi:hypothetical protein
VIHNNKHTFVEAKYIPSQSGQIVVLPSNGQFIFSPASANTSNTFTSQIINKINENYTQYETVEQSSISIEIDGSILFGWIKQTYLDKNSEWLISSDKYENLSVSDLVFIPINEMSTYFDVSIVLRRKKSGSTSLAASRRKDVNLLTQSLFHQDIQVVGKKSYVTLQNLPNNIHLNEIYCLKKEPINGHLYEIRKKGTTNNANIMFQLTLKDARIFKEVKFKEFYHQSLSL